MDSLGKNRVRRGSEGDPARHGWATRPALFYATRIVLCCDDENILLVCPFSVARLPGATAGVSRGGHDMSAVRLLAIVLIVAGALGLLYGGFTYTRETHEAKLGPIELSIKDKETVNVPVWAGVGAIVAGVILLFARK